MKVSGFTFIKDAIIYDYPIVESILSILPICDEFVVAVGKSDDDTLQLIQSLDSEKIRIVETIWDDSLREGGKVLAVETDKAFSAISEEVDWAFYIQGDEVVHERYLPEIVTAMQAFQNDGEVDGLLFKYLHFYGSYDYVGTASNWYKHEIRVIKNDVSFYSYRDAQGFRKGNNEKLKVVPIDAYIYHYGWVKQPEAMQRKQVNFNKLWHNDDWIEEHVEKVQAYDYEGHISELARFEGEHPNVMKDRIARLNWEFEYDISFNKRSLKDRLKSFALKYLHLDFSYRNYKMLNRRDFKDHD